MFIEKRILPRFKSILLKGIGNVVVNKGNENSIKLNSDRDILTKIKTKVINDELIISLTPTFPFWLASFPRIDMHVVMEEILALRVSGVGRIRTDTELSSDNLIVFNNGVGGMQLKLNCKEVKTYLKGVGEIELSGQTDNHEVEITGTGKVNAYNLESKTAKVNAKGVGECVVSASEELFVEMSGVGRVRYRGNPEVHRNQTGLGSIEPVP